jgi:multiple sugar transport system substrate-binding protein
LSAGAGVARAVLLAALPVLASAGCGHGGNATELRFWAMGREGEVVTQLMPEFERRHPGVRVRVQQIPWSAAHEKLLTSYVGGAMPDVFQAGNTWLPELAALGALEPLDERIARSVSVVPADYFPGVLDTNVVDGRTVGVPWYVDTRLLFYRPDLLAAAGHPDPPRTWADWRDAMERVAQHGGPGRFAVLLPLREWQPPVILALQLGAELLRDGDRFGNFRSPAFKTAFDFYLDLFARGLAPRAGDTQVTNVYQDFAAGTFALYVTGPWNIAEFEHRLPPDVRWATAPMPAPHEPGVGLSLAGGASLAVAHGTRQPDVAWQLAEYLSEPAQQVQFHRLTGDLPARMSAWQEAALAQDAHAAAFWTQLHAVAPTPRIPEWERIASKISQYVEAAVRGDLTADAALAALDHDVDVVLEKRRWLLARAEAR